MLYRRELYLIYALELQYTLMWTKCDENCVTFILYAVIFFAVYLEHVRMYSYIVCICFISWINKACRCVFLVVILVMLLIKMFIVVKNLNGSMRCRPGLQIYSSHDTNRNTVLRRRDPTYIKRYCSHETTQIYSSHDTNRNTELRRIDPTYMKSYCSHDTTQIYSSHDT